MKKRRNWLLVGGWWLVAVLLFVVISIWLLAGRLGINGYLSYDNLDEERNRGITGNSVLGDLWNKFFGRDVQALSSPETCTIFVDKQNAGDCASGNYNVSSRICDGNDGNKFDNLQEAGNVAVAGDVVCVRDGIYTETLMPANSGTAEQKITFKAYPGDECKGTYTKTDCRVAIDGQNTRAMGVNVNGKSYVRIEGFEIRNFARSANTGGPIYIQHPSQNGMNAIEIANNYIHDGAGENTAAIYAMGGLNGLLVENNEIKEVYTGVYFGGLSQFADGITVRGNHIWSTHCEGASAAGPSSKARNITIEQNNIHGAREDDPYGYGCHKDGLDMGGSISNLVARNNIIYDYSQNIYFPTKDNSGLLVENVEIYGNIVYTEANDGYYGGTGKGIFLDIRNAGSSARNISIHSNTAGWLGSSKLGITVSGISGNVQNVKIYNNILYNSNIAVNGTTDLVSNYNLIFGGSSNAAEGSNTITGQDPQFVAYTGQGSANFDFHLLPTSPAINAGNPNLASVVNLPSLFLDLDGTTRPQGAAYDIGAYEYPAGSCTYTINAGESINKYSSTARAGETVCVRAGTYNETLRPANSGTAGNLITFKAYPGDECKGNSGQPKVAGSCKVKIDGTGSFGSGVDLHGKSYIRVEGFEIKLWSENGIYGNNYVDSMTKDIEVVNNYIHDVGLGNVGNTNEDGSALLATHIDTLLFQNNEIFNTGDAGISCSGPFGCKNFTIRGNNIHRTGQDGIMTNAWRGDLGDPNNFLYFAEDFLIENNVFSDSFLSGQHQDGINTHSAKNWIIRNNVLSDYTQLIYFPLGDSYNSIAENIQIYGNVFYNEHYRADYGGDTQCIFFGDGLRGGFTQSANIIRNISIHSNTCGWVGYGPIWIFGVTGTEMSNIKITNNIFYDKAPDIAGGNITGLYSNYNLYFKGTKPAFEGTNSITNLDPQFVNYVATNDPSYTPSHIPWDFRLKSTSPAIDESPALATLVSLPNPFKDIDGTLRPQGTAFDIGAYEYIGEVCQPTTEIQCNKFDEDCNGYDLCDIQSCNGQASVVFENFEGSKVTINNCDVVTIRNCKLIGPSPTTSGEGILVTNSQNINVENCEISNWYEGIHGWNNNHVTIKSSYIHDINEDPIKLADTHNLLIENNTIAHLYGQLGAHADGMDLRTTDNVTIRNNFVYDVNGNSAIQFSPAPEAGSQLNRGGNNLTIENNILYDGKIGSFLLRVYDSYDVKVFNNVLWHDYWGGAHFATYGPANYPNGSAYIGTGVRNLKVYNNILESIDFSENGLPNEYQGNYNIYFKRGAGFTDSIKGTNDVIGIDPKFKNIDGNSDGITNTNPKIDDFKLQLTSPAIDSGTSDFNAPNRDLLYNLRFDESSINNTGSGSRGNYYDRGAIEYKSLTQAQCSTNAECNDNNQCTDDTCNPSSPNATSFGCAYDNSISGTACLISGAQCASNQQCNGNGQCVATANNALCLNPNGCSSVVCNVNNYMCEYSGCPCQTSSSSWTNNAFTFQTGNFVVEFDATPNADNIDAVIGLSNGVASAYSNLAAIVRFAPAPSGAIDVRDGGTYRTDATINYVIGTSYKIRMEIDVVNKRYNVKVTPQGEVPTTIATNYAFRTEQAGVTQLNNWAMDNVAGAETICNFILNPEQTCITQSALNIEIQKFYNSQIGIVEMSNKIIEYLGC